MPVYRTTFRIADTFRIINIDADPDAGNFTADQIGQLKADGRNRVISYLNLGAAERSRSYWSTVPEGSLPRVLMAFISITSKSLNASRTPDRSLRVMPNAVKAGWIWSPPFGPLILICCS